MFKLYEPTEVELDMLNYKSFLICNGNFEDQNNIIGCAARAILDFDYYFYKSGDFTVWEKREKEIDYVVKLLDAIKDESIREHFKKCFNIEDHNRVMSIFEWGEYVNIQSKYVSYRFSGVSDEEARYKVGLYNWINDIINMVQEYNCCYRALYANNIYAANKILLDGLYWFDETDPIKPLTVPNKLWVELSKLGSLYKTNNIKFTELKELYPYNISLMLEDRVEVLKINTFYMLFTY